VVVTSGHDRLLAPRRYHAPVISGAHDIQVIFFWATDTINQSLGSPANPPLRTPQTVTLRPDGSRLA
jgi:hypothetical protein